ncbi:MAG: phosphatidate cytidylyltransferase [Acidaminococcaceae bacterium]
MLTRIMTALVGIPVAIFLIHSGGTYFAAAILILAMIGWYEFRQMMLGKGYRVYYFTSCTAVVAINLFAWQGYPEAIVPILTASILGIMLEGLYFHKRGNWAPEVALSSCAVLYIGLLFAHFSLLREITPQVVTIANIGKMPLGEAFLWLVLLGTWASDTFAYFFGCAFGKHRLCPEVSPKKSIEGAVAGFIGCVLVITALGSEVLALNSFKVILLAVLIGIFAPLGDLVESLLKRSFGVKDSGNVFPGHGGVLDRFDSLLFAVPIAYYFILYNFF